MGLPHPDFRSPDLDAPFLRDGWLVAPSLGPPEIEALRTLWAEVGPEHAGAMATTSHRTDSEPLRRRVSETIGRAAESLTSDLVPGYRFVSAGFMVKRPGAGAVRLHRHEALLDEGRHAALLVWVPLQDTSSESGCMVVVSGTHRSRSLTGLEIPESPEAREVPMAAGQALVMDHRLIHGSRPNLSGDERLAVSILLAPDRVPLWYCRRSPRLLEIFEVPDDFYLRWIDGVPPPVETPPLFRFPVAG